MVAHKLEEEEELVQEDVEETTSLVIGKLDTLLDPLEQCFAINSAPATLHISPERHGYLSPANNLINVDDFIVNASDTPEMMIIDAGLEEGDLVYEVDDVALLSPPEQEYEFKPSRLPWKIVLMATGLWFPRTWMRVPLWTTIVYCIQFLVIALLTLYFLQECGIPILGHGWVSNIEINTRFPFTVAHCVIWEFRWLLTYILGIIYGHSRHLEKFVAHLKLPKSMMRKISILQRIYLALLLLVVLIMPGVLHWFVLRRWGHVHTLVPMLDSLLFFLYRVVSIPSFCMVTYLLYLNGCAILTLGGRLYRTDAHRGIHAAKRAVLVTKRIISDTEAGVQYYLLFHFLLILVAAFTGIFSCVERLEFKTNLKNGTSITIQHPSAQLRPDAVVKLLNLQRQMQLMSPQVPGNSIPAAFSHNEAFSVSTRPALIQLKQKQVAKKQPSMLLLDIVKGLEYGDGNHTSNTIVTGPSSWKKIPEFLNSSSVVILSVCSLCEVLVLYLVPIFLILWQNKCLREVRNNVIGLDTVIQEEGGYVFQSEDLKQEVVKYLEIVQPVRVWGYEVSIYQAIFFTCLAQIVAVTMKTVIGKIDKDL